MKIDQFLNPVEEKVADNWKDLDFFYVDQYAPKNYESTSGVVVVVVVVVVVNLFLFLLTFLNVLNNMDYTVTYFLSIPSTEHRTRARSELLNISLVSPRVEFCTALPVSLLVVVVRSMKYFPILCK